MREGDDEVSLSTIYWYLNCIPTWDDKYSIRTGVSSIRTGVSNIRTGVSIVNNKELGIRQTIADEEYRD